jgi:hypothetical protein
MLYTIKIDNRWIGQAISQNRFGTSVSGRDRTVLVSSLMFANRYTLDDLIKLESLLTHLRKELKCEIAIEKDMERKVA